MRIAASEMLRLDAEVDLPPCLNETRSAALSFEWTLTCLSCTTNPRPLIFSTRKMVLAPQSLSAGEKYQVKIECTIEAGSTAQALAEITVIRAQVVAAIAGGHRQVWEGTRHLVTLVKTGQK